MAFKLLLLSHPYKPHYGVQVVALEKKYYLCTILILSGAEQAGPREFSKRRRGPQEVFLLFLLI
jgi:hypothetical protein